MIHRPGYGNLQRKTAAIFRGVRIHIHHLDRCIGSRIVSVMGGQLIHIQWPGKRQIDGHHRVITGLLNALFHQVYVAGGK
ncbi:MAG: hypothetical protein CML06_04185 [Pseudomonadales bacterium]|nr:hypothetical protein [Pseudomonadales bacterium]